MKTKLTAKDRKTLEDCANLHETAANLILFQPDIDKTVEQRKRMKEQHRRYARAIRKAMKVIKT